MKVRDYLSSVGAELYPSTVEEAREFIKRVWMQYGEEMEFSDFKELESSPGAVVMREAMRIADILGDRDVVHEVAH